MDDNNRRRRQNEPPYQGSDPRYGADRNMSRGFTAPSTADRFRPAPITTTSSMSPVAGGATAYSGYYPEPTSSFPTPLPQNTMQYQPGYPQDQRQQPGFATYNQDIMYNVTPQTQQNHVYDSNPQFQTRQPASMQTLSDMATPYFPNEPTSAPSVPGLQHHASSASSSYQQHQGSPSDRGSLIPQNYPGNMPMGGMASNAPELMGGEEEYQAPNPGMEEAYTAYQTALKEIFQNIINGRLAEAAQSLLEVSEWLLGHVGDLGLIVDEVALHGDRIRLWNEFNTAWLGIFQKQKDMLESRHQIQPPQSLMTKDFINKMAKDLIRMCDAVERHGLVDYQYGVAEEQIIDILEQCLDLQEHLESGHNLINHVPGLGRAPP